MASICRVYERGKQVATSAPLVESGRTALAVDGFVWVDLERPTTEELSEVTSQFDLPAMAVDDVVKEHTRPKLQVHADVVFIILKSIDYVNSEKVVDASEVAVFVGGHFIVTVGHVQSPVLRQVRAQLDGDDADFRDLGPMSVLLLTTSLLIDGYEEAIEQINGEVDTIETQVFGPGSDDHAERIYKLKREVAEFRRAVIPLARGLEQMAADDAPTTSFVALPHLYVREVLQKALRAADGVEGFDRLLTDVLQANVARVSEGQSRTALRQNEDTRKISAWAAIALVPTMFTGVYGMNFDIMPELRWNYGYFIILALMVTSCAILYRLFRRNGWL